MSVWKSLSVAGLVAALTLPAAGAFARDRDGGHSDDYNRQRYTYDSGRDRHGHDDGRGYEYSRRDGDRGRARAAANGYGRGYDKGYENGYRDGVRFDNRDRYRFRDWSRRYPAYYKPIPPGHYHAPVRGAYLPRGYYRPLPPVMVRELRPLPRGYGYYSVGADVVIAAVATGIILDVILAGR
ncbi:MAG: hypothetical protein PHS60_04735 [Zavarzinia sp.]|nr:hypothetical protein [Zavarzinia sp.]